MSNPADLRNDADKLGGLLLQESLYERLRRYALTAPAHQKICSPRELAQMHNVSVSTARRAMDQLAAEGLVYAVRGKGTFVAEGEPEPERSVVTLLYADAWQEETHPFYVRRLHGILAEAESLGCRVQLASWCSPTDEAVRQTIEEARRPDVRGLLVPWLRWSTYESLIRTCPDLCVLSILTPVEECPDVTSVLPDMESLTSQAMGRLLEAGAERIAAVCLSGMALAAAEKAGAERNRATVASIQVPHPINVEGAVAQLGELRPDALIFDDDKAARDTLEGLRALDPDYVVGLKVVSYANRGEDVLPPHVSRMEIDPFEVGRTAVYTLRTMIDTGRLKGVSIRVRPRWIPGENSWSGT